MPPFWTIDPSSIAGAAGRSACRSPPRTRAARRRASGSSAPSGSPFGIVQSPSVAVREVRPARVREEHLEAAVARPGGRGGSRRSFVRPSWRDGRARTRLLRARSLRAQLREERRGALVVRPRDGVLVRRRRLGERGGPSRTARATGGRSRGPRRRSRATRPTRSRGQGTRRHTPSGRGARSGRSPGRRRPDRARPSRVRSASSSMDRLEDRCAGPAMAQRSARSRPPARSATGTTIRPPSRDPSAMRRRGGRPIGSSRTIAIATEASMTTLAVRSFLVVPTRRSSRRAAIRSVRRSWSWRIHSARSGHHRARDTTARISLAERHQSIQRLDPLRRAAPRGRDRAARRPRPRSGTPAAVVALDEDPLARRGGIQDLPEALAHVHRRNGSHSRP